MNFKALKVGLKAPETINASNFIIFCGGQHILNPGDRLVIPAFLIVEGETKNLVTSSLPGLFSKHGIVVIPQFFLTDDEISVMVMNTLDPSPPTNAEALFGSSRRFQFNPADPLAKLTVL